ncbi:hypothetical protein ABZ584_28030 [Streptomyces antibioticus]|uniref:hypothetical protein n=1 Tax=Streptomyces antibioticus TaxID=1890 RepID=UPI0033C02479
MRTAAALARHELRLLVSLLRWLARRPDSGGDGDGKGGVRAFGYAQGQGAVMAGFWFVCTVETFAMAVLLRNWPTAHRVVLVLDLYTLLFVAGLYAAWTVRPHLLHDDVLRVRQAAHVDLRVPLNRIAAVRRETRTTHERADGELNLPVGSRTTVTLQLTAPIAHFTLLGRRRDVTLIRLHADDDRALADAVTRARSGSSVRPDRPR